MSEDIKKTEEPTSKVEDGKILVDAETFNAYKNDMHKYKDERNQLKESMESLEKKITDFNTKEKKEKESKLLEQEKYKELVDEKSKEILEMTTKFNQQKIDNELKTKAMMMGINDANDVKLVDMTDVKINETGNLEGVDESLKLLKEKKPYLFSDSKPEVDTGKAGSIPDTVTWDDVKKDYKLAMKLNKENPDKYQALKNGG